MSNNAARFRVASAGFRRGFTLVELLVALAVLVIAMSIVTTVFTVASSTAAQTTAISDVENRLRSFTDQLQADLDGIDPAQSILVMVGRTIPAARTIDDIPARRYQRFLVGDPNDVQPPDYQPEFDNDVDNATGNDRPEYSDPRADILMFFSNRTVISQAPAPAGLDERYYPYLSGAKLGPIQVVYGHAALDTAKEIPGTVPPQFEFNSKTNLNLLKHVASRLKDGSNRSVLPLTQWMLARRVAIIEEPDGPPAPVTVPSLIIGGNGNTFDDDDHLGRIMQCYTDPEDNELPGDMMVFRLKDYLRQFGPAPQIGGITQTVTGIANQPIAGYRASPYGFDSDTIAASGLPGGQVTQWPPPARNLIEGVLYPDTNSGIELRHVATAIENPPPNLASNLGLQALPACAFFKVEFLMPEDAANSIESADTRSATQVPFAERLRRVNGLRWVEVPNDATYVFVPDTAENRDVVARQVVSSGFANIINARGRLQDFSPVDPDALTPPLAAGVNTAAIRRIRMWPYAIRITVKVYDRDGRLPDPIERSMIKVFR